MKDRDQGWCWSIFLLLLAGHITSCNAQNSYNGARGDSGDTNPAQLGFGGVVQRHDGYVKGETPTIPQTSFSCSAQPYNPGLYADVETQCQVYHVCFEDRQESFLCGPGTNFNQRILACDFWYNFNCQDSPSFYSVNADIGKVPDSVFKPDQARVPQQPRQPQQPSYPNFPQPAQPPSGGSYPPHVSVPPPPPRVQPQSPRPVPHDPQPPRVQPQPPRPVPRDPQPPRIQPQQPRPEPQRPVQPPRIPQPPAFRPEQPRVPHQPPRVYPEPPAFRPQPRPETPQVSVAVKPQYPGVPSASGHEVRVPPSTQQEEDNGYQFDGYNPPKPVSLPPPQPSRNQPPRPVFPPVVSPPRIARPPLTPPVVRQPEISRPRVPVIDNRNEYHPDANLKGNTDYRPPQPARIPEPSRPIRTDYPSYPVPQRPVVRQRPVPQRPVEKPSRPAYQPPTTIQQEHVDTEYVPPPPPPQRPKEPSRPTGTYVPPPPPVQQEVSKVDFVPQQPARPAYVPPPVSQRPVERPQPPVSPSIIREQQKPASPPPSRPQVSVGARQPQQPARPKPVFPPVSDHPNSNIKGGPGYNQPPPQIPRFEPTRISRPSTPQGGYQVPQQVSEVRPVSSGSAVKPSTGKKPTASGQGAYKPPEQSRVKKPSEPIRSVYQPPIQVIDHPQAEIKGTGYEPIRQQQRQQSPSSSSGVKRPVSNQRPQVQRPRAPVVVRRPQPPSLPTANIKTTSPLDTSPEAPAGVKLPSQQIHTSRPSQPRFPNYDETDHPNANVKGYLQPQIQPVRRPAVPPSAPSTSYEQKTTSSNQGHGTGGGYQPPPSYPPRGDFGSVQQVQDYKPSRSSPPSSIKTVSKISQGSVAVKDVTGYPKPPSASQHSVLINKQSKPDYEAGSSYTRGPEVYPKPEFGQPNAPYQPVSTPSRPSQPVKQGPSSQNSITQIQVKPDYRGTSASAGSGSHSRPDYPFNQVPGHQPPYERQVFPHRENPDHPNESIKGSAAYRPPPPAGYQAAASEVQEQVAVPEPEPSSPLHGDTGSE